MRDCTLIKPSWTTRLRVQATAEWGVGYSVGVPWVPWVPIDMYCGGGTAGESIELRLLRHSNPAGVGTCHDLSMV